MPVRNTSRGVVIHDGNILLIERYRDSLHYFSIPGGGIEVGETPEQTVLREITEESSCIVSINRKLYVMKRPDGSLHHIYLCDYKSGIPYLPEDSEEAQVFNDNNQFIPKWIPLADFAISTFNIWLPIQAQLLHDLSHGFHAEVREIGAR